MLHRVTPIWGHDLPSLREMRRLKGLAMRVGANLCGYVLYEPAETGAAELLDLAALDAPHGAALLAALQAQHERIICNNEPEDSPVLAAFEATGFRQTLRRYEMEMQL